MGGTPPSDLIYSPVNPPVMGLRLHNRDNVPRFFYCAVPRMYTKWRNVRAYYVEAEDRHPSYQVLCDLAYVDTNGSGTGTSGVYASSGTGVAFDSGPKRISYTATGAVEATNYSGTFWMLRCHVPPEYTIDDPSGISGFTIEEYDASGN